MEKNYSVLMSVYNKEKPDNLNLSVASVLNQTIPPEQFVIVCDGFLGDELNNVLARFTEQYPKLFWIEQLQENKGLGVALNIGLKLCHNDIVARMDSDDISRPDRCERQFRIIERDGYDLVSGTLQEFSKKPGDMDRLTLGATIFPLSSAATFSISIREELVQEPMQT